MADENDLPPRSTDFEDKGEGEGERKRLFERTIPEVFKRVVERAVETGAAKLADGPENLRNLMGDMKLPKEVLHYLYTQIDDTKSGLYRVVAKEIRDVLERMQFADEITKVLTKLSFEIRTEIRFIPNDAAQQTEKPRGDTDDDEDELEGSSGSSSSGGGGGGGGLPKPDVSTQVTVKDRSKEARRDRRRREDT
jgi:hypothetical protein